MSSSVPSRAPLKYLLVTLLIAVGISLPVSLLITWLVGFSGIPIPSFVLTGISGFIIGWRVGTVRSQSWTRKQLRKQREEEELRESSSDERFNW